MNDAHGQGKYSRTLGVDSYRKRRRWSRVWRVVVVIILVGIIGGATYLFGKQFVDVNTMPFDLSGVMPTTKTPVADAGAGEAPAPTTVQPASISIVAAGDVVVEGAATESGRLDSGAYEFDHLFKRIRGELHDFDLRIVQQEDLLAGGDYGFGASNPLNAPQELGRAEEDAGFNVILRANDHALDTGAEGIHNELVWWHDTLPDMPVLGLADKNAESNPTLSNFVSNVYLYEKDGFRIAILNHSVDIPDEDRDMVSQLSEEKIRDDVSKARAQGAEMIVACVHWGEENNGDVVEDQEHFARVYAELGVDVVFGTHPRTLQRAEVLEAGGHRTVCFYSLGCLITGQGDNSLLGGFGEVRLSRTETGGYEVSFAQLRPVVVHRSNGEDYNAIMLSDYTDELCWNSWDGWITVDEYHRRCSEALGEDYDAGSGSLTIVDTGDGPAQSGDEPSDEQEGNNGEPNDEGENEGRDEGEGEAGQEW